MAGDIVTRHADADEVVFREGDEPDGCYVILEGKVRIFKEQHGHETTLAILKPGDFFGEMSLFDGKPRSASAQVLGNGAELRFIGRAELDRLVPDPFVRQLLHKMSERLREVDDAFEKLEFDNAARHTYLENLSIHRDWAV